MTRHFLQLYLLIVATLAAVSWGQERLWQAYTARTDAAALAESRAQSAALTLVEAQLRDVPRDERRQFVADLARRTSLDLELFELQDLAGDDTVARLKAGEIALMRAAEKEWLLKQLPSDGRVLAFRY